MAFLAKIFYSVFFIIIGILLIRYRKILHDWTGSFAWAEKYLGRGGTYLVLLIIGLGCIFYGAIYPFGGLEILGGN